MISIEQKNIIEGCLLGDGCLCIGKKGKNPYFSYCSKNKDHVEFVFGLLKNLCNYNEIKKTKYFDKRTSKYYTCFRFITKCLEDLMPIYLKWYKNKEKNIIPDDLILNKTKCLLWYIGDGSLIKGKRSFNIKIATQCFDIDDLKIKILPQLSEFSPRIYCYDNQPIIYIPRNKIKNFLEYIGDCPVPSYSYKWDIEDYKYKKYENGIDTINEKIISEIGVLYDNGWSYYKIGKHFDLEPNRVKYYLIKMKKLKKGRDKLKKKLNDEDIRTIKKLRNEKIPWVEIEEKFNLSRFILSYYIKTIDNDK